MGLTRGGESITRQEFLDKVLPKLGFVFLSNLHLPVSERRQEPDYLLFADEQIFLDYDGIPWNNNNAEHAIKAYAALRNVMEGTSTRAGTEEYLILLSICETCEYQGLDFLDFLCSGEKDIEAFSQSGRRKSAVDRTSLTARIPVPPEGHARRVCGQLRAGSSTIMRDVMRDVVDGVE